MPFYIKKNDTSPALRATLKDGLGSAVDLTGTVVRFHMREIGALTAKVDSLASLIDPGNGVVEYSWSAGDTDTLGSFEGEFEVIYAGGEVESFPNNRHIEIEITDDIS